MIALAAVVAVTAAGVQAPFAAPPEEARLANERGFSAYRKREFEAARAGFARALELAPEYDAARYNLATCHAAEGRWEEAFAAVEPLLARNLPRYERRLLTDFDWAPIQALDRERERLRALLAAARARYADGLSRMLPFVARFRSPSRSQLGEGVRSYRHQEVYAFDLATGMYRALTDTDGRVLALVRAMGGARIAFVTQEKSKVLAGGEVLEDAAVTEIDLRTFEATPKRALPPDTLTAMIGYGDAGLDVTVVRMGQPAPPARAEPVGERVLLEGLKVKVTQGSGPLLPAKVRELGGRLFSWSPSGERVLAARPFEPCARAARKGELWLAHRQRGSPSAIAKERSRFRPVWLDEQTFAFERGEKEKPEVEVRREGGGRFILRAREGAGLHAIDAAECPR